MNFVFYYFFFFFLKKKQHAKNLYYSHNYGLCGHVVHKHVTITVFTVDISDFPLVSMC